MPIVSLEEGIQIGTVKGLVIDSMKMEVCAIVLEQRRWLREQRIIPYSKIRSVGNDAITIDQSSNAQKPFNFPEILKLIKEKSDPIGTKVVAENGTILGIVDEYYIDESTGKITSLEISGKLLEGFFKGKALLATDHIRTMGREVIVVREGAEKELKKIDGGIQDKLNNFKEKTKEVGKTIKEKYEKKSELSKPTIEQAIDDIVEKAEALPVVEKAENIQVKKENILPKATDENNPK